MLLKNITSIVRDQQCCGCGTCNAVCPKHAISMVFNPMGQLLAQIDESKCVDCGVCVNNCPSHDAKSTIGRYLTDGDIAANIKGVYTGRAADEHILLNGQSGGLVTAILTHLFEQNSIDAAVVCRVSHADTYSANAIVVTSAPELMQCQKSSYTPLDMVSALKQTREYRAVAFVGTGCHIQGVRTLQANGQQANIAVLIGLICDRVLAKTASDVLMGSHFEGEKRKIIWRDKRQHYKSAKLIIQTENGQELEIPSWKRHALKDHFTPPRCLACFDKLNVCADIVVGDPWGMSNIDWQHGESVVMTRTELGQNIIDRLRNEGAAILREASKDELLKGQNIAGKAKRLNDVLNIYADKGWMLPDYAAQLMGERTTAHSSLRGQIERFVNDASDTKKSIIRKYRRKLAWLSIKMKIHNWIHLRH